MPYFNDETYFERRADTRFTTYDVGTHAPVSGIYKCTLCGHEIVIDEPRTLPPDGDHGCKLPTLFQEFEAQNSNKAAPEKYEWRLVAAPMHQSGGKFVIK